MAWTDTRAYSYGLLTASQVDDVFFILKKCGLRALSAASAPCACSLLAELNNILANSLRGALSTRLSSAPARLLALAPAAGQPGAAQTAHDPAAAAAEQARVRLGPGSARCSNSSTVVAAPASAVCRSLPLCVRQMRCW